MIDTSPGTFLKGLINFWFTIFQILTGNSYIHLKKDAMIFKIGKIVLLNIDLTRVYTSEQYVIVLGASHNEYGEKLCKLLLTIKHVYVINIDYPKSSDILSGYDNYHHITCLDFGNWCELKSCMDEAERKFSRNTIQQNILNKKENKMSLPLILINNIDVGYNFNTEPKVKILKESRDEFVAITTSNITNVILLFQEILRKYENNIYLYLVNITNTISLDPTLSGTTSYAYSSSKAAIAQFHESLSYEIYNERILKVNNSKTLLIVLPHSPPVPLFKFKKYFSSLNSNDTTIKLEKRANNGVQSIINALQNGRRGELYLGLSFLDRLKLYRVVEYRQFADLHRFSR